MFRIKNLLGGILFLLILLPIFQVQALNTSLIYQVRIDTSTLAKGYTFVSPDKKFYLGIRPEVLAEETDFYLKQYPASEFTFPQGLEPITEVYEFDIMNKEAFKNEKPLLLRFNTLEENYLKELYFWNGAINQWVKLPSNTGSLINVNSVIHLPYAKLVILKDSSKMAIGDASWYKYKNCNCAASPDYSKGSNLKVKNLDTGDFVVVKVNDFGPERDIHPNRVIDLDAVAFEKLGKLSRGILKNILVEFIN